jgi:hypothetical protein
VWGVNRGRCVCEGVRVRVCERVCVCVCKGECSEPRRCVLMLWVCVGG